MDVPRRIDIVQDLGLESIKATCCQLIKEDKNLRNKKLALVLCEIQRIGWKVPTETKIGLIDFSDPTERVFCTLQKCGDTPFLSHGGTSDDLRGFGGHSGLHASWSTVILAVFEREPEENDK